MYERYSFYTMYFLKHFISHFNEMWVKQKNFSQHSYRNKCLIKINWDKCLKALIYQRILISFRNDLCSKIFAQNLK
jgi:hypothetical protein